MSLPKRVVLSRKGFDGGTGCVPSPILDDGTMLSLPIPDSQGPVTYADLAFSGHSFGKLVADLKAKRKTRKKETKPLSAADRAHLDPDLIPELRRRKPGWRPAFGQCGGDTTHLLERGVGRGDLFIFFGWFHRCELAGGTYRFLPEAPDIHVVFGYLRIGEVVRLSRDPIPEWARDHAQLYGAARTSDQRNTLFVAADRLELPGAEGLPGAGAFVKFTEKLQLTMPGEARRSIWRLPRWFHPRPGASPLSYHKNDKRWSVQDEDACLLQSVGRGQEFVLEAEHYPKATEWIAEMIRHGTGDAR